MHLTLRDGLVSLSLALALLACGEDDSGDDESTRTRDAASDAARGDAGRDASRADARTDREDEGDEGEDDRRDAGSDAATGNVRTGIGADCSDADCPEGLRCDTASSCRGFECPSVCVRDTESCVEDPCGDDAYCIPFAGADNGTCEPRGLQGEPCSMPPGGDPDINPCAAGLFCSSDSDTCVPALAAGTVCPGLWWGTDRQACEAGYTCRSEGVEDATCLPVKMDGESCLNPTDCAEGSTCKTGKCEPGRTGSRVRTSAR